MSAKIIAMSMTGRTEHMMHVDHYMRWNMATCARMPWFNAWEELERLCPYKRHRRVLWLPLQGDANPADPRFTDEERSWAVWHRFIDFEDWYGI